jgi:hypothetical protein
MRSSMGSPRMVHGIVLEIRLSKTQSRRRLPPSCQHLHLIAINRSLRTQTICCLPTTPCFHNTSLDMIRPQIPSTGIQLLSKCITRVCLCSFLRNTTAPHRHADVIVAFPLSVWGPKTIARAAPGGVGELGGGWQAGLGLQACCCRRHQRCKHRRADGLVAADLAATLGASFSGSPR